MRAATRRLLIASLLTTSLGALASADAVSDDPNRTRIAAGHASAPASMQPLADIQAERYGIAAFITAYGNWRNEQEKKYRMGALPRAQEQAIIAYAERGECAVLNGLLFGVGWHHIPDHEQYADEDAVRYGESIDALVELCEAIKRYRALVRGPADERRHP